MNAHARDWKAGDRLELDMSFAAHDVADAPEGFIAGIASTPSTDLYSHKVATEVSPGQMSILRPRRAPNED